MSVTSAARAGVGRAEVDERDRGPLANAGISGANRFLCAVGKRQPLARASGTRRPRRHDRIHSRQSDSLITYGYCEKLSAGIFPCRFRRMMRWRRKKGSRKHSDGLLPGVSEGVSGARIEAELRSCYPLFSWQPITD
ncbi:hypothetical protein WBK31_33765 [Nonomuraea sp. N2-4H]|uniref:hypothetical protein n=1 Tax=Nonomuraea sp. N2-4H TaxID=3128898 RepID=UPI00325057AE